MVTNVSSQHGKHSVLPQNRITASLVFLVGASCMVVAGYFLIEGLSQFSGDDTTRNILIIGGILFQITESLCFIAAASLAFHSVTWRLSLFGLGCILFLFSIGVMTLAQKTALQTGINEASAIDEKRVQIRDQLASLDRMIESYRYNAEKQSKSIYKDSRALGQDSINRAAELEREKLKLSEQLFQLNQERKETSIDFFIRLEEVTGLPAVNTEFYFLVLRSLLLELCGIILMAFAANLRALISHQRKPQTVEVAESDHSEQTPVKKPVQNSVVKRVSQSSLFKKKRKAAANNTPEPSNKPAVISELAPSVLKQSEAANQPMELETEFDIENVDLDAEIAYLEAREREESSTHNYSEYINELRRTEDMSRDEKEVAAMGASLMELYQRGIITTLNREGIIRGLAKHHNINIDSDKAKQIKQYLLAENQL